MAELLLVSSVLAVGYALSGEKKSNNNPIARIPTKSIVTFVDLPLFTKINL